MKLLGTLAFLIVAATASQAVAASLPKPAPPFGRPSAGRLTHGMRSDARPKLPKPVAMTSRDRDGADRQSHGMRTR
jgi:hypothetical protein